MVQLPFTDRRAAGRLLGAALEALPLRHPLVLALPRGGVPVGFEVAQKLQVPLDVFLVRKLGVPGQRELAMGALATGNIRILNDGLVAELGVPPGTVEQVTEAERVELERRERAYRDGRPAEPVTERDVILVDDGLATGATMRVAIKAVRQRNPGSLTVAVPVGPVEAGDEVGQLVDRFVCLAAPQPFWAVGAWYQDFSPTDDDEVRSLLALARGVRAGEARG